MNNAQKRSNTGMRGTTTVTSNIANPRWVQRPAWCAALLIIICAILPRLGMSLLPSHSNLQVTFAKDAPTIDGHLDDAVWQHRTFFTGFRQQTPTPFAAPSEQTEVAAAYDALFLYVAVRCHVTLANSISSRFVRRDRDGDFDKIELIISPMNDGETGYGFLVNPAGMKQDGMWSADTAFDRNWDAVWEVATSQSPHQWTAEFAIPWDQMRFSENLSHLGFQVKRWMAGPHELVVFNPKKQNEIGEVSKTGRLTGLNDLAPVLPFSVRPEVVVSYLTKDDGMDSTAPKGGAIGAGGYIKAGVAPGWTVDIAVMPDFGEVELDKATLNLSNVETVHPEKRPFFIENRQLFETPIQLFYSRRLGAAPSMPSVSDTETIIEAPLNTPIVMASKFSGISDSGNSLGVMHVLSAPTRVRVDNSDNGIERNQNATFWTHSTVLRLSKQFHNGSNVGMMATGHTPENHEDSGYVGSIDWNMFSKNKVYAFKGQTAASAIQDDESPNFRSGMGLYSWLGRQGGDHFRPSLQYDYRSDGFDTNHLGYLSRDDLHRVSTTLHFLQTTKGKLTYEWNTGVQLFQQWNHTGLNTDRTGVYYLSIKWKNRMWTHMNAYAHLTRFDDLEFADGPALKRIPGGGGWFGLVTPGELPVGFTFNGNLGTDDTGYYFIISPAFQLRTGRFEIELYSSLVRSKDRESYGDTVEQQTGDQYILARRNLLQMDVGFKATVVLARQLTAELNTQLLAAKTHYHHFRELRPDSAVTPVEYNGNLDFGKTDWNLQALLRYEFRPQSILYLVYTRQGEGELADARYTFKRTWQTFDHYAEQRFLIKASYLF